MTRLQWDVVGTRSYQTGIDHGVLYLPDGTAVVWSGLTKVDDSPDRETNPVYYDGKKISNGVSVGDFSAKLSAITYPDEIEILEGGVDIREGVRVGDQPPQLFGLSYRTMIGNDVAGATASYMLHLVWNVTAVPSDKSFSSVSDNTEPVEFQWDLVAVPERVPGIRPTAKLTINMSKLDPVLAAEVEDILYGGDSSEATLPPMLDFVSYLKDWVEQED